MFIVKANIEDRQEKVRKNDEGKINGQKEEEPKIRKIKQQHT